MITFLTVLRSQAYVSFAFFVAALLFIETGCNFDERAERITVVVTCQDQTTEIVGYQKFSNIDAAAKFQKATDIGSMPVREGGFIQLTILHSARNETRLLDKFLIVEIEKSNGEKSREMVVITDDIIASRKIELHSQQESDSEIYGRGKKREQVQEKMIQNDKNPR